MFAGLIGRLAGGTGRICYGHGPMQLASEGLSPGPSQADQELISGAKQAGALVSPRQLKRWRAAGLLPSPTRRGLGRGRGSRSAYPPGTLERVLALARLPRRARSPGAAVLSLFSLGYEVEEAALRRAHSEWVTQTEERLRQGAGSADPLDMAEVAAMRMLGPFLRTRLGRQYLRRLRHRGEPPRDVLVSAMTGLTSLVVSGEPSSSEAIREYLDAAGTPQALARAGLSPEQAMRELLADPAVLEGLAAISLRRLASTFADASMDELDQARRALASILGWLRGPGLTMLAASLAGPLVAGMDAEYLSILERDLVGRATVGVPVLLEARRLLGNQLPSFLAWLGDLPGETALSRVSDKHHLPDTS